ncbi:unnamed protein product [Ectocarpus sp. 12 AP-2014]
MRRPGRPRPAPGGFLIALATARKSFTRAFCFGGGSSSSVGKRLFRSTTAESSAKAGTGPHGLATATPPESPFPPAGDDGELESFFLLRHGQTNFNAIGRIQGTLDSSILTEEGISQALEAGKTLASYADLDLGPTVVVSPMGRAQQTLECVRQELRKSEISKDFETVEIVPDIREIELFEWQGQLKEDIIKNNPEQYASWVADPSNFNFSGRYPARDLWKRASNAWDQIRSLQSIQDQPRTLVVAHNAINQALLWTALGCDTTYFRKLSWPNCAVLELQWRRGEARAERYRWVVPEASGFVEAADAARLLKDGKDDNRYTL